MNVLAIGAHPDDLEILCGGTLALYAAAGHRVTMAVATNGNVGHPTLGRDEIAALRHAEQQASAEVIGAELVWMDFDDEWLFNDRPTRERFIDVIRGCSPDVVFAHSPSDYHPDHRAAGQLTVDSRIPAAVRLVETTLPAAERIPHVFLMDNVGGVDFVPEVHVDVTDVLATKERMLLCHRSQDAWLRAIYDGMDYVSFMREHTAARGAEAGVAFAESFREVRTHPPTGSIELLPGTVRRAGAGEAAP
jgi:LmbE family N-acetylglucosaminyl deacetylase